MTFTPRPTLVPSLLLLSLLTTLLLSPAVGSSESYYPTTTSSPEPEGQCPDGDWTAYGTRCYWVSSFVAPWRIITDLCSFLAPGATPVSIHDSDDNNFIVGLAKSDSWIGLRRYGSTRDWRWADGSACNYHPYDSNIGSYGSRDQCLSVAPNATSWIVRSCDEDLYVICQVDQQL